ncbi:MAG: hypothetical protein Q4G05_04735 [Clostridia bacterium]|nr:hypothetical protein [Clostridia bacterium]
MEIAKLIVIIICVIISLIGVIFVYDARRIIKKLFSFGDQNEGSFILKICGFGMSVIASLIIMILMK